MTEAVNSIQYLNNKLENIKSEQGFIGKFWNSVKEGASESKCQTMLEDYKNGLISFEEAVQYIEDFERKQKTASELISNVATGAGSIAFTIGALGSGPIGWGAALTYGATSGAALKTAINLTDRATNDVKNDEFDAKTIAKDAIKGATTGLTSAVSSHILTGVQQGKLGLSLLNGAKYGAECGAVAGSMNYITDSVFDEDKEFNFGDLTRHTLTSAAISGSVGTVVGAGVYGLENVLGNTGKEIAMSAAKQTAFDSTTSSTRKLLAQGERNIFMKSYA